MNKTDDTIWTFDEIAENPAVLGFDKDAPIESESRLGNVRAQDGSVSSWDIVKASRGGYIIKITLVEGADDGEGGHEILSEEERQSVVFVPVRETPSELVGIYEYDYMPEEYESPSDAYAAFLDVVYAHDGDSCTYHVKLANETTATAFDYEVHGAVLSLLRRTSESELSEIMPKIRANSTQDEAAEYAEALEAFACRSGLPEKVCDVSRIEVPDFWFSSGWDMCVCNGEQNSEQGSSSDSVAVPITNEEPPVFPKEIPYDVEAFSESVVFCEGDFSTVLDEKVLPTTFSCWGFGVCPCLERLYVMLTATPKDDSTDVDPDKAWFAAYVVETDRLVHAVTAWTEDGLPAQLDGHRIDWIPDLFASEQMLRKVFQRRN